MKCPILTIWLLVIFQRLYAQPAPVLPADSLLPLITRNSLLLQAYTMRAQACRLNAGTALAWAPTVAGAGTFMIPYSARFVYNDVALGSWLFQAAQAIPSFGQQRARYRYLAFQADMALTSGAVVVQQQYVKARLQYIRWVMALHKIRVWRRQEAVLSFIHRVALSRLAYRQSHIEDINTTAMQVTETQLRINATAAQAASMEVQLRGLLRQPDHFTADSSYAPVFRPGNKDTAILATTNKQLYQLEEAIQWQYLGREALRRERKPGIHIGFYQFFPLSPLVPNSFTVMAGIRIPLGAGYYRRRERAISARISTLAQQRTSLLIQTQTRLTTLEADIRVTQQRINGITSKILPALEQTLEAAIARYQENKLELTAVLRSLEALTIMEAQLLDYRQQLYEMVTIYDGQLYH